MREPRIHTVAGHSLGGVFAVLFADDMRRAKLIAPTVFTFGAPRIGNRAFADAVDSPDVFRIYNPGDPVTRVPPLCRHVGRPVELAFAGNGLERHCLENYIRALDDGDDSRQTT